MRDSQLFVELRALTHQFGEIEIITVSLPESGHTVTLRRKLRERLVLPHLTIEWQTLSR
jgi:hypothetical protein